MLPVPAQPITRQQLADELKAAVRAEGYQAGAHFLEAEGSCALDNGQSINFELLYGEIAAAPPKRRADALQQAARVLVHPPRVPETWDEAKTQVLPIVKKRIDLAADEVRRTLGQGPAPTLVADITPHLAFALGIQGSGATVTVPAEALGRWGISPEAAFRTAGRNLEERSGGNWQLGKDAPGVWVSPWRDGLDVSRLFLPRVFGRVPMRGRPVVLAPLPSFLLVAGSEDENGLLQLGLLARRTIEKENLLHILRPLRMGKDGESWEDWVPPQGHPARGPLRLLQAKDEARDYDEHAALVRKLAEGRPTPPMPQLILLQAAGGAEVMTVTIWRAGKPTALPKADTIILVRGAEIVGACTWASVAGAPGTRLEALPGYPTRYLATDFPEEWQFGAMDLKPWGGPLPT